MCVYSLLERQGREERREKSFVVTNSFRGDERGERKREKAEEEEEEGAMATPLNKLRILFCGVEFPGAVHHTQQFLKPYPHISVSQISYKIYLWCVLFVLGGGGFYVALGHWRN